MTTHNVMVKREALDKIHQRRDQIKEWIADEAPYITADQKHLDRDSPERAYWHYGYQAGLNDALNLLVPTPKDSPR